MFLLWFFRGDCDSSLYSHNHTSTLLLTPSVEQPIGTGFSYGDNPQDEHDVSTDMYAFMQNFYKVFPHLAEYDFFVTGESYAGTCVMSFVR